MKKESDFFEIGCLLRTKTKDELVKEFWDKHLKRNDGELTADRMEYLKLREQDLPRNGFFFGDTNDDGTDKYPGNVYVSYANEHLFIVPFGYTGLLLVEKKFRRDIIYCKVLFKERIAWLYDEYLLKYERSNK
jgi:hypothetical protein